MVKMSTLKTIVRNVTAVCVSVVVSNILKKAQEESGNPVIKIAGSIGSLLLTGYVAKKVCDHVEQSMDEGLEKIELEYQDYEVTEKA